ncbi:MAG: hypothetical protein ACJ79O_01305, partial [Myxococcales bacterium]
MPIRAQPGLVCVALVACHGGASAPAVPNPPGGSVQSVATQIDFVPAALLSSEQLRPSLVVSGTELYFSDASEHPVKRVSVSGGTPTPLAYRAGAPVRLVVSGGTVFWSDGGRLFRTSIDTRETTLLASGNLETSPTLLAEGDAVYWVRTVSSGDCSPACIHRIERIAGGTTSVVAEARQEISGFVQETAWVYWAERGFGPASATCNCGSAVKKAPKAGGPATLLVDGTLNGLFPPPPPPFIQAGWSPSANVALSGGSVIFSDGVRILSIPLAGGSVSIVATLVTPRPRALVADATSVFWIDDRSASTAALPAGTPAVLATELTAPVDLFLDATGLLVADRGGPLGCCLAVGAGTILQIPRTGGEVVVRAAHLDAPTSVSTDGDSLYWTEAWRVGSMPAA